MSKQRFAWISGAALITAVGVTAVTQIGQAGHAPSGRPGAAAKGSWVVAHGLDAPTDKFRFTVMFSFPRVPRANGTTEASACSGALISPEWVATAGHCFHDNSAGRKRVSGKPRYKAIASIGQTSISRADGEKIVAVDVRQAPDVDFALVHLAKPAQNTEPIALSTSAPPTGRILRLTGWGISRNNPNDPADLADRPDLLQTGLVKITRVTDDSVFVTGKSPAKDTSACPFDSGAPYFSEKTGSRPRLVATEVGGPSCPHSNEETTARVDTLIPWITKQDPSIVPPR
jgi:hypothetical protein